MATGKVVAILEAFQDALEAITTGNGYDITIKEVLVSDATGFMGLAKEKLPAVLITGEVSLDPHTNEEYGDTISLELGIFYNASSTDTSSLSNYDKLTTNIKEKINSNITLSLNYVNYIFWTYELIPLEVTDLERYYTIMRCNIHFTYDKDSP